MHIYFKKLFILIVFAVLGCAVITSCKQGKFERTPNTASEERADSIVNAIGDARDLPRLLTVIDSLEKRGELSRVKAIFYTTITHNLAGHYSLSLPLYYELAEIDMQSLSHGDDLETYVFTFNNYIRVLCEMKRYDAAMREAFTVDEKLKTIGYDTFLDHHDIAETIGVCQLNLGQNELAAKSFQKTLQAIHERLTKYKNAPLDLRECQKTMNAIAQAYIEKGRYIEARPWVERQDSLFSIANNQQQRDTIYVDEMKSEIGFTKALLAYYQGNPYQAENAYDVYLTTSNSKTLENSIKSCEYLLLTERYEEAANYFKQLDQFMGEAAYEASLENIGRYLMPKFRANLLSGRKDTALNVAVQIAEAYDSAFIRQKQSVAYEVAAVYDIQGKERQIAEQEAKMQQERVMSTIVVLVLVIVFFFIYAINSRKAYDKLTETNRQLKIANKKAEESARMKQEFIQQISHEVRTPLNVLSGFTQVLTDSNIELDTDELQVISEKMVQSSERITQLVDKMLALSDANSNSTIELIDTATPSALATIAVDLSHIQLASHLEFQMKDSLAAQSTLFKTNIELASKSLSLLLDNAIKFTRPAESRNIDPAAEKAKVTLGVDVQNDKVSFVVEDTGIGIPPEEAEHIFEQFVQLDDYYEGTGIGLTIARSLARQLNGDVVLDTSYTDGARFIMTLFTHN
jgi:signal transduction histidine kinase